MTEHNRHTHIAAILLFIVVCQFKCLAGRRLSLHTITISHLQSIWTKFVGYVHANICQQQRLPSTDYLQIVFVICVDSSDSSWDFVSFWRFGISVVYVIKPVAYCSRLINCTIVWLRTESLFNFSVKIVSFRRVLDVIVLMASSHMIGNNSFWEFIQFDCLLSDETHNIAYELWKMWDSFIFQTEKSKYNSQLRKMKHLFEVQTIKRLRHSYRRIVH